MTEMKRMLCQELISLYLASLLLVISGSGLPQMGGGSQMAGAPSAQMEGASSPQMGWGPSAQSGHSSPQMGETKGHVISGPGGDNPEDAPMKADGMGKVSEDVVVQNWQGIAAKGN